MPKREMCPYCGETGWLSNYRRDKGLAFSLCYLQWTLFNEGPLAVKS